MEVVEEGIMDCKDRWGPRASDLIEEPTLLRVTVSRCDIDDFLGLGRDGILRVRVRRSGKAVCGCDVSPSEIEAANGSVST